MIETRPLRLAGILAALTLACLPLATAAQQRHVPVIAGQNAGYDACGTVGVVRGLDPRGDGFLAVRAGPSSNCAKRDELYNGNLVYVCDQSGKGGNWLGVVYTRGNADCGVGTPWPRAAAYRGPCSSGWVYRKYIADYAG